MNAFSFLTPVGALASKNLTDDAAAAQAGAEGPAARRKRREAAKAGQGMDGGALVAGLERPKFGVERFIEEGLNQLGGTRKTGDDRAAGFVYPSGPYKGMSEAQVAEQLRQKYAAMGPEDRARYEAQASNADVTSDREKGLMQSHQNAVAQANGLPTTPASGSAAATVAPSPAPGKVSGGSSLDYLRPRAEVAARAKAGAASVGQGLGGGTVATGAGSPVARNAPTATTARASSKGATFADVLEKTGGGAGRGPRRF